MGKKEDHAGGQDKKLAAVCGLYCEACTLFIATTEDPEGSKDWQSGFSFQKKL